MKTKLLYGYPSTSLQAFASAKVLRIFAVRASGDFSFISRGKRRTMRLSANPAQGIVGTIVNWREWRAKVIQ